MWWQVIVNGAGYIAVGIVFGTLFGFTLCACLVAAKDADRQGKIMQMAEDARRDA